VCVCVCVCVCVGPSGWLPTKIAYLHMVTCHNILNGLDVEYWCLR